MYKDSFCRVIMLLYSAWVWEVLKRVQQYWCFLDEAGGHSVSYLLLNIGTAAINTHNLQWYQGDIGSLWFFVLFLFFVSAYHIANRKELPTDGCYVVVRCPLNTIRVICY